MEPTAIAHWVILEIFVCMWWYVKSFGPLVAMLNIFPVEKKIVNREIISGEYVASSYYLSRVIAELPLLTFNTG